MTDRLNPTRQNLHPTELRNTLITACSARGSTEVSQVGEAKAPLLQDEVELPTAGLEPRVVTVIARVRGL